MRDNEGTPFMARNVPRPFHAVRRFYTASLLSLPLLSVAVTFIPFLTYAAGGFDDQSFITGTNPLVARAPIDPSDSTGAFIFEVPILTPPGRNGVQPNLKLTYSSQSAQSSSPFGLGWSINIPYIERINKRGTNNLYSEGQPNTYFYSSLSGEIIPAQSMVATSSVLSTTAEFATSTVPGFPSLESSVSILAPLLDVGSDTPTTTVEVTETASVSGQTNVLLAPIQSLGRHPVPFVDENKERAASAQLTADDFVRPDGVSLNGRELTGERLLNAKKYMIQMGRAAHAVYHFFEHPIHYRDPITSQLEDINTQIVDTGENFQMTSAPIRVAFSKDGGQQLFTFAHDGQELYVDTPNRGVASVHRGSLASTTNTRNLTYPDAIAPGIDIEMIVDEEKLAKEIVFREKPKLNASAYYEIPFTLSANRPMTVTADGMTLAEGASLISSSTVVISDDQGVVSYILPPTAVSSGSDATSTPVVIPIEIVYTQKGNVVTFTKRIPTAWLDRATYPVRTDATFSLYTGSGDGYIKNYTGGLTWSQARGNTSGSIALPSATYVVAMSGLVVADGSYAVTRGFIPIDTSSLPDSEAITSATFYAYPAGREITDEDAYSYAQLVGSTTQSSVSTLTVSDFSRCAPLDLATRWSDTKISSSTPWSGAYSAFPFNATGTANISKTGWTMLGFREGHDLENNTPNALIDFDFYSSETSGTSNDPYLEVVTAAQIDNPTDLWTEGALNPSNISTGSPKFSAVFHSTTGTTSALHYQIQVTRSASDWLTPIWDSGKTTLATTTSAGARSPDISYSGTLLPIDGTKYYWRIRFWDQNTATSSWSTSGDSFVMAFGTTNYMAKIEQGDFMRYTYTGTSGDKWIAYDKSGLRYRFGYSSSTQLFNPGTPSEVYRWMIEDITDPNGNSIVFSYATDSAQLYPWKISYTSNGASTGLFEVEFIRESRPDTGTSSAYGFSVGTKQRIKEIQAKVSGSWERKYALAYATSTTGTRSLLASVTETGRDPVSGLTTSLPPTSFEYQTQTKGWSGASWTSPVSFPNGIEFADMNSDGYTDLIQGNVAYFQGPEVLKTYLNNGTSTWTEKAGWGPPVRLYTQYNGNPDHGVRVADMNGDLRPDLIQALNSGGSILDAYRGDGVTPWVQTPSWAPTLFIAVGYISGDPGMRIFDVNGDGMTDQVNDSIVQPGGANSSGTGWGGGGWTMPYGITFRYGTQIGDVNGDGLPDLVYSRTGCTATSSTWINNGRGGWTRDTTWGAPPVAFAYDGCTSIHSNGARLVDVNGDGLADILFNEQNGSSGGYINNGHGWDSDSSWTPPLFLANALNDADVGTRLFDFNADGMVDIISSSAYINAAARPDLLVRVLTPNGGTRTASYDTAQHQRDSSGALLNPKLPIVVDVVTQTADDPGFGGAIATTTFSYAGGEFYYSAWDDRKFAGFGSTTKTNSLGHTIRTSYHQGNASDSANGEYNDHASKIGRPYRIEVLDSTTTSANLFSRTINTWARADYGDGRNFVRLWKLLLQTFDGDSLHRDTAEARFHDTANGNLVEVDSFGEVNGNIDGTWTDTGTDFASTTYAYAASTTNTVMSLPAREFVADQNGSTVRETKWTYDGVSFGTLSKGNQTKEEKLKSGLNYASSTRTYNAYGLVTLMTDPRGGTTTYTYDTFNLYPATTTNALGQTQTFVYDYSSGKVATTTDANSRIFTTDFDGLDRPIREKQPDFTTPATLVPAVDYTYTDSTSTPSSVLKRSYLNSASSSDFYTYLDGHGRTIQTRKEAETAGIFSVSDTQYNTIGQVGTTSLPYFDPGSTRTAPTTTSYLLTTQTYDATGRVKTIADVFGTTTNLYNDWLLRTTDTLGNHRDVIKDAYGNLASVVEKLSFSQTATTTYVWNLNKNLTKITDALGNIRNFTYDNLGRLLVSEDLHASGDTTFGTTTRAYDDAGNVTSLINPRGQTTNYTYDALNRAKTEDFTGLSGTEVQYFYDTCINGKGRLCSVQKQSEATTTYAYNPIGLVTAEGKTVGLGSTAITATTSFTHFRNSKEERIVYPDAAQVYYLYDNAGLLDKILSKESGGSTSTVVTRTTYTPLEQIEGLDYANGVNSTSTYDKAQKYRLTSKFSKNSLPLQDLRYTYDVVGNITTLHDYASTSARKSVNYTYDPLYRLLSASTTAVATGTSGYLQSFTYDALGNMLTGPSGSYTYGQTGYANPDALTALGGLTYGYDNAGNLTSSGSSTFVWDYNNRMASATVITASTTVGGGGGGTSTATPAFVQSKKDSVNGVATFNSAVTTGNLVVVGVTNWNTSIPTNAVSDNKGNTYTRIVETINTASTDHGALFYAKNVTGGSSFTVTSSVGGTIAIHEYSGVSTSSPFDKVASSTGLSTTPNSGNVTTTLGNELYVGLAWSGQHGDSWTAGNTYTLRENETNNNTAERIATEDNVISTASTTFAKFSVPTSENWLAIIATFKPLVTTSGTGTATTTTYSTSTVTYLYDHSGARVQMKDSATTTQYFGKLYQQTPNGYTKTKNIYASGQLVATVEKKGSASVIPYYISTDHLGGSNVLTNASGTATQTLDYFPFGDIRANAKNTSSDIARKYIGEINDTATNFDYLNARYYDARRGQFTSQDPVARDLPLLRKMPAYILSLNSAASTIDQTAVLADPQSQNLYSYSLDNPVAKRDPSGQYFEVSISGTALGSSGSLGVRADARGTISVVASGGAGVGFGGYPIAVSYTPGPLPTKTESKTAIGGSAARGIGLGWSRAGDFEARTSSLVNSSDQVSVVAGLGREAFIRREISIPILGGDPPSGLTLTKGSSASTPNYTTVLTNNSSVLANPSRQENIQSKQNTSVPQSGPSARQ